MSGMGIDRSGNGNHWVPNNLATTDQMVDTPTNNFATFNPIQNADDGETSEGNLKVTTGVSTYKGHYSTIGMSSGKWYAEFLLNVTGGWNIYGIAAGKAVNTYNNAFRGTLSFSPLASSYGYGAGQLWVDGVSVSGYSPPTNAGDVVQVAVDLDNNKVYFGKNGTWENSANPSAGTGYITIIPETYLFGYSFDHNGMAGNTYANFGQDATFAGNKSPSTVYDDGKYGSFFYQPPTGFKALCTQNLPGPVVKPDEHFNAVTYTGTGSNQSITGAGFQPDLIWFKNRSVGQSHALIDIVRGRSYGMSSNDSAADSVSSSTEDLVSFDADGFTVGTPARWGSTNNNGGSIVAWNWKAGGTAVSNTNGSITSSVSANTAAGFSIVSYTGTSGTSKTIGHGLSSAPEMMIVKDRDSAQEWVVYHHGVASDPETDYLRLDSSAVVADYGFWYDTAPTASVFTVDDLRPTGSGHGDKYIAYCFHSVDGFSKFGSYEGNGSADGSFVYTGFRPAMILLKDIDNNQPWNLYDTDRSAFNVADTPLRAHTSAAEAGPAAHMQIDILSNGFKHRTADGNSNASGETYIYMAFAEFPFKYANAR